MADSLSGTAQGSAAGAAGLSSLTVDDWQAQLSNAQNPSKPVGASVATVVDEPDDGVDWDFISQQEGGQRLDGYVPINPDGSVVNSSGVTVATGVDLGQRSEAEIRALDIPDTLKDKLAPYANRTRDDAATFLDSNPLALTTEEADQLDRAVKADALDDIASNYNEATANNPRFDELPSEAQTVVASVGFQYGADLESATPNFWDAVTTQDWESAIRELRNFGDDFPSRRNREADVLEPIVDP